MLYPTELRGQNLNIDSFLPLKISRPFGLEINSAVDLCRLQLHKSRPHLATGPYFIMASNFWCGKIVVNNGGIITGTLKLTRTFQLKNEKRQSFDCLLARVFLKNAFKTEIIVPWPSFAAKWSQSAWNLLHRVSPALLQRSFWLTQ